jgi:hypothetical protein
MPKVTDLEITENGPATTTVPTRTKTRPHPRLVNRGPAGLLHKVDKIEGDIVNGDSLEKAKATLVVAKYRITPDLQPLAKPIDIMVHDPRNARVHGPRNMEAIKQSLQQYGQVKPIVVRRSDNVVMAGNGTLQAARELGWTEIAATYVDMNSVEAAGFGLADNRTAELAKWDFEIVALLDKELQEAGHLNIGWSDDELSILRAASWETEAIEDIVFGSGGESLEEESQPLLVSFTPDQHAVVSQAMKEYVEANGDPEMDRGEVLKRICEAWRTYYSLERGESSAEGGPSIQPLEDPEVGKRSLSFDTNRGVKPRLGPK